MGNIGLQLLPNNLQAGQERHDDDQEQQFFDLGIIHPKLRVRFVGELDRRL